MVIFKGVRIQREWLIGSLANTVVCASKDGYVNKELFLEFWQKFVYLLKTKSDPRKHVLIMDEHGSHIYNYEFMIMMKVNNVEVIWPPPHAMHWLHPADKSLFKSLKAHWEEACRKRVASCGGCRLPKKKFFMLFTKVWQSCTTVEICQSGFRATGMFPVNGRCIPEVAYAPSLTTERVQSEPLTFVSQWSTTAAVGEPSVSVSGPAAAVGEPSVLGPAGTPSSSDTLTATHNVWRSRQWWTTSVCLAS